MTTKPRADLLTTTEMYHLDVACRPIVKAFGDFPYLVGSAGNGDKDTYRDVDIRLMLDEEQFWLVCPDQARWELLCLAISAYLSDRTGLPVDFQIQTARLANDRFPGKGCRRNPLGTGRMFAGGGDGTPEWEKEGGA